MGDRRSMDANRVRRTHKRGSANALSRVELTSCAGIRWSNLRVPAGGDHYGNRRLKAEPFAANVRNADDHQHQSLDNW